MNEHESATEPDAAWQPFVDALCAASSTWDAGPGRSPDKERQDPISLGQAENVMLAIAALTQRMGTATVSIVRAIADTRLAPVTGADDLSDEVESLGRMALCADALHRAAELARAVGDQQNNDV
ncbi:hypothetical protein SK571_26895 [Lentzea sp. BCCO 10_0798]|uniref:ANTAR domain-containing protein n=1 Tax=Lentzea kristufekii TaxID=3095430 RepID=A0ABU4TXR0_9PSEU|nr:hypothetical protein [Lentzea sp. BCCO 10_0798]MDX8053021.1 hypothetical protein [Lentzea sp. BCCO 10_0798]